MGYSNSLTHLYEERSWIKEVAVVLGASIVIALCAPISIHLPFTPVPIAIRAQVIMILAALLGSKRASLAVMAFIFQGAIGLPVFAGVNAGLLFLAGPTGGYILGYLPAAFVTGLLLENCSERTASKTFLAMLVGNAIIFFFGFTWLSNFVGISGAFTMGVLPFLIGDFLKVLFSVKVLKKLRCFKSA